MADRVDPLLIAVGIAAFAFAFGVIADATRDIAVRTVTGVRVDRADITSALEKLIRTGEISDEAVRIARRVRIDDYSADDAIRHAVDIVLLSIAQRREADKPKAG